MADITEFPTGEGKLHLAGVRDLCHRGLVGWSMGARPDAELVVDALVMALGRAEPDGDGLVHHSDKGGAYVSGDFCSMADVAGLQVSFGSTGDCWDNAAMETFWSTLKREITWIRGSIWFETRHDARLYLFEFIETPHQPKASSSSWGHACREGLVGVVNDVGDEAEVELADELVEQVPERRDVVVAVVSTTLEVSSSIRVVPNGGHGPDIAGCGEPVVLCSSSADPGRPGARATAATRCAPFPAIRRAVWDTLCGPAPMASGRRR